MRKIITLLAILLVTFSQSSFSQSTIFGRVIDAKDGSGIPGASVIVKGTTIGGVTNSSGNFAIMNVPNDSILQVSFIGFKTFEIAVENQTRFEITLEPDVQVLGDVVVTADKNQRETVTTTFGIERDPKTITTATYQISGDELRRGGSTSLQESIYHSVPGVQAQMVRGVFEITHIRGITSFAGARPPLWVVDGIPFEGGSPPLDIENVESVTVLSSANAAILYGSAAANGAIVITTKKR